MRITCAVHDVYFVRQHDPRDSSATITFYALRPIDRSYPLTCAEEGKHGKCAYRHSSGSRLSLYLAVHSCGGARAPSHHSHSLPFMPLARGGRNH
eukprot:scaffold2788_cov32-Tisochrysis_lutea.AAC.4